VQGHVCPQAQGYQGSEHHAIGASEFRTTGPGLFDFASLVHSLIRTYMVCLITHWRVTAEDIRKQDRRWFSPSSFTCQIEVNVQVGRWLLDITYHEYDRNVFIVIGGVNYALCESGKVIKWRW